MWKMLLMTVSPTRKIEASPKNKKVVIHKIIVQRKVEIGYGIERADMEHATIIIVFGGVFKNIGQHPGKGIHFRVELNDHAIDGHHGKDAV